LEERLLLAVFSRSPKAENGQKQSLETQQRICNELPIARSTLLEQAGTG